MSISISLPDDLEQLLEAHAQQMGVPLDILLARTIVERWDGIRHAPGLSAEETELLLRLQTLFPEEQTREYKTLCERSDAGTLSEADRERLLNLIEQRDYQNAERLEIVGKLASFRSVSLREMMGRLGIRPD